jgi:predicted GIY-YIG superfamily endonuclease
VTDLYRFFDADDQLLYVGISLNAAMRASQHRADKAWRPDVIRMEVERIPGERSDAIAAEADAIRREQPLHNVTHNARPVVAFPPLVWLCRECEQPIADGDGYLTVSAAEQRAHRARKADRPDGAPLTMSDVMHHQRPTWRAFHRSCDPDLADAGYWFDVARIRTVDDVLDWTAHLIGKRWLPDTNWKQVLEHVRQQWATP